jgi:hypothetical protein
MQFVEERASEVCMCFGGVAWMKEGAQATLRTRIEGGAYVQDPRRWISM